MGRSPGRVLQTLLQSGGPEAVASTHLEPKQRSAGSPMPASVRRRMATALTLAALGAILIVASGGPAGAAATTAEVKGTAQFKWEPGDLTIQPGDSVKFTVEGGGP